MTSTAAPRRATTPTRLLLSTAAIGAAGGILVVALNYALIAVPPSTLSYSIYTATIGVWALGPLVAMALFRRPGVALLTALFAGVINLVVPTGLPQLLNFLVGGILIELPFAVLWYRRLGDRAVRIAFPIGMLLMSGVYLSTCLAAGAIRLNEWLPWLAIGTVVGAVAVAAGLTVLATDVAARLRHAGVGVGARDLADEDDDEDNEDGPAGDADASRATAP